MPSADLGAPRGPRKPIVVCWGELLWDVFDDRKLLGGSSANVAYHTSLRGGVASLVSCVGNDELGREALARLSQAGVDVSQVAVDHRHPTGWVAVTLNQGQPHFNIASNAAWDHIQPTEETRRRLLAADIICFGTLAQRTSLMKTRLFSELATLRRLGSRTWLNGIARDRPILVADLNLRPPFNDVDTVTRALSAADVLKVNEEELDFLAATFRVAQPVKWVFSHFNTQLIAVTRGEKGASLFGRTVEAHVAGHRVCGGDPVGAGDAFVASLSLSLVNRNSIVRCLEDANRYAAWVASQRGGMPQVSTQAPA